MKKLIFLTCSIFVTTAFANSYLKVGKAYLYVNSSTNIVQCQVQQLCDIALAPGDVFQSWIMTNGDIWADSAKAKTNYTDGQGIEHVILQATAPSTKNLVILVGTNYQYHFNLIASNKAKTNEYVFVDKPENNFNTTNAIIDNGLVLDFKDKKLDNQYYFKGDTNSFIMPVKVFNDGHSSYIQMPDNIDTTDLPTISTFGLQGQLVQLTPRYRKPYFVIDTLVSRIALISGSDENDNKLRIDIYRGKKPGFWKWLTQQYDRN